MDLCMDGTRLDTQLGTVSDNTDSQMEQSGGLGGNVKRA